MLQPRSKEGRLFLLKWIVYGIAILLLSGVVGILVGKVIGFSESTEDGRVPEKYGIAKPTGR
jgi:hypothetical protein